MQLTAPSVGGSNNTVNNNTTTNITNSSTTIVSNDPDVDEATGYIKSDRVAATSTLPIASAGNHRVFAGVFKRGGLNDNRVEVALKEFKDEKDEAAIGEARLLRVVLKNNCDNVVKCFGLWKCDDLSNSALFGSRFVVLQKLETPLPDAIASNLSEARRLAITYDIVCGLDFLRAQRPVIVHGDLSAKNVILTKEGRAVLIDFDAYATLKTLNVIRERRTPSSHAALHGAGAVARTQPQDAAVGCLRAGRAAVRAVEPQLRR